jgi:hypothetical protein
MFNFFNILLVCNNNLFNDKWKLIFLGIFVNIWIFQRCKVEIRERPTITIGELLIDKYFSWDFLVGLRSTLLIKCWRRIFISKSHFVKFKYGLGPSFNNLVELKVLRCLLKLANEKGIVELRVYGDSFLVFN